MRSLFSYFLLTSRLLLDGDYLLNGITADGTGSLLARAGNFRPLQPALQAELPVPAWNDHGRLLTVEANGTGVIVLFRYLRLLFPYFLLCLAPSERLARWAILAAAVFPVFEDLPRERAEQSPTGSAQLAGPHVVEHVLHDAAAWKIALCNTASILDDFPFPSAALVRVEHEGQLLPDQPLLLRFQVAEVHLLLLQLFQALLVPLNFVCLYQRMAHGTLWPVAVLPVSDDLS